jgi:hypothetical protein
MNNKTLDMNKLFTITCTKLDWKRKWWQVWKPKVYYTTHYMAHVNRTGEAFKCPPEILPVLHTLLEAIEAEVRHELSH